MRYNITELFNEQPAVVKDTVISLILLILFFSIAFGTGILFSGFQFKDDHLIISIYEQINDQGFYHVLHEQVTNFMRSRFLPLHIIHRVVRIQLFGTNPLFYYAYTTFLAGSCAVFLYLFSRTSGFSPGESAFFSLFTLLGQQAACWWRLGTAEPVGMLLLALSLYFLSKNIFNASRNNVFGFFSGVCLIASALCKESFLLMIPAVLFLKIWFYAAKNNVSFLESVIKNKFSIIFLSFFLILDLYMIIVRVGINTELLGGVSGKNGFMYFFMDPVSAIRDINIPFFVLLEFITFIVILTGAFFVMQSTLDESEKPGAVDIFKVFSEKLLYPATLFMLILIPQLIIHSKTGIRQRFWIPAFIAFSFFMVYLIREITGSEKTRYFTRSTFLILTALMFVPRIGHTLFRLGLLAERGKNSNYFINEIVQSTEPDSKILIVADPANNAEAIGALTDFIKYSHGRENCYYMLINTPRIFHTPEITQSLASSVREKYKGRLFNDPESNKNIECIALFPGLEQLFLDRSKSWFVAERYSKSFFDYIEGSFVVYRRNHQ